jgi:hypothetical protein
MKDSKKDITFEFAEEGEGEVLTGDLPDPQNAADAKNEKSENDGDKEKLGGRSESNFDAGKYKNTEWEKLVENLEKTKDLRKNFLESYNNIIKEGISSDLYVKRFRHFEDMIVKDVLPTIYGIEKPFEEEIKKAENELEHHNERNRIIEEFRNPEFKEPNKVTIEKENNKKLQQLNMPESERDDYFDSILSIRKEDQLNEFISRFSGYDPDKGDLPLVYRDLYYKNLQRIAYTFSGDPTYFATDYFEENLNKEDYLKNALDLVSKMKNTKTASEILFTILDIYEIQERAINQVFQSREFLKTIDPKLNKEIRVETIKRVIEKYSPIFAQKKIENFADVQRHYHKKKLEIIDYLINTSPSNYRGADAHFEKGRLLWERGLQLNDKTILEKAVAEWKEIESISKKENDDFLNSKTFQLIQPLLSEFTQSNNSQATINQLNMFLQTRMSDVLEAKRKREEKLLWPKGKSQANSK